MRQALPSDRSAWIADAGVCDETDGAAERGARFRALARWSVRVHAGAAGVAGSGRRDVVPGRHRNSVRSTARGRGGRVRRRCHSRDRELQCP